MLILGPDVNFTNLTVSATCTRHRNNGDVSVSRVTAAKCVARGVEVKGAAGDEGHRSSKSEHALFASVTLHGENSCGKNMFDHYYGVSRPPQSWRVSPMLIQTKLKLGSRFRGGS